MIILEVEFEDCPDSKVWVVGRGRLQEFSLGVINMNKKIIQIFFL